MTRKKPIEPGEKFGLKLTPAQRSLLIEASLPIPKEVEQAIRSTPVNDPLMLTLDDLDDLAGHVAANANHAGEKSLRDKLDRISRKIEKVMGSFAEEDPRIGEAPSPFARDLIDIFLGHEPAIFPRPSEVRKSGETFLIKFTEKQREAIFAATRLRRGLKNKIGQVPEGIQVVEFTRKELGQTACELKIAVGFAPDPYRKRIANALAKVQALLDDLG
jgi:hypothetical protein